MSILDTTPGEDPRRSGEADAAGRREPRSFGGDDISADWTEKLDGDMKRVLDRFSDFDPQPIETLTAEEARRQPTPADAAQALLREDGKDEAADLKIATRDFEIPGPGGPIPARLYGPETDGHTDKKLPVVVYWHGGGFVIADNLNVYDSSPRAIAKFANCIVVSCHYRLAPENKFPAAHDDAFAAYQWTVENAASFGGDPDKIAVMGESAGGNLAANVAILARDRGVQAPLAMVLVYPLAQNDMETASYRTFANAKPLNKPMLKWFVEKYLNSEAEAADPRINLVAADLKNLPPATILRAEIDPLQDDGRLLGDAIEAAGGKVHDHLYEGVTHEFFGMGLVVKKAAAAEQAAAHDLKKAFGTALLPF